MNKHGIVVQSEKGDIESRAQETFKVIMIKKSWEKKTVLPTMDYDPRNFHCTSEASRISMAQSWQHCLRKKFPSIAHTCVPTTHVRFYLMTNLHI